MIDNQIGVQRERSIGEHYLIASSFGKDLAAVSGRGGSIEESIKQLFDFYIGHYRRQGVSLEIEKDGEALYTSIPAGLINPNRNKAAATGTNVVYTEKTKNGVLLFVSGGVPGADNYFLKYALDISEDISSLREAQRTMLLAGAVFSALAAVFLYFALNSVFKPLSLVSAASKKIAAGGYGHKITIRGHNEATEMADSFNNMAEEIRKHISRMAESSDKNQRFADNFSHEIRTPLTAIYGTTEYLQKTDVSEEEKYKLTGRIITECKHVMDIAERMLELATLRSPEINMEMVRVSGLFESVEESVRAKLDDKLIELKREGDVDFLVGDKSLLKSLLINLVNNAADACPYGGHIVWGVSPSVNGRVLTVMDNGKGVPAEQLDRVTEPFYRIDKAKRRSEGGAGLGLSICSQICACHNAVMSFKSVEGVGTTVTVIFTSP
ncbi:MAG: HAMP domain-containing histidine kinase [Clostridiales bacterium]|nr:HAMP domain-containing histidine kinase [Clostridiales bacterium]